MRPLLVVLSVFVLLGFFCSKVDFGDSGGFRDSVAVDTQSFDSEPPRLCVDYSGFLSPQSQHAYRTPDDWAAENGTAGTWSRGITSWEESDGVVLITVEQSGSFAVTGYESYTTLQRSSYRCDADGVWLLSTRLEYAYTYHGAAYSGWSEVSYTDPMLVLRPELTVGSSWGSTTHTVTTTSSGGAPEQDLAYHFEVSGEESISVPAGEFSALKLVNTLDGSEVWLDADAGLVRSANMELSGWTP